MSFDSTVDLVHTISAEDNDDLVDMLDKCAPKLRACYGDFYISEMVLQTSTRDIIVCEVDINSP